MVTKWNLVCTCILVYRRLGGEWLCLGAWLQFYVQSIFLYLRKKRSHIFLETNPVIRRENSTDITKLNNSSHIPKHFSLPSSNSDCEDLFLLASLVCIISGVSSKLAHFVSCQSPAYAQCKQQIDGSRGHAGSLIQQLWLGSYAQTGRSAVSVSGSPRPAALSSRGGPR